ncbi:MAG: hypothetical protein WC819_04815 [Parcubacteria group bacterium]|jgi:hypothetical protein
MVPLRPNEKRRKITCHACKQKCECTFNRRYTIREMQSGKARLDMGELGYMAVLLHDISCAGVGFSISHGQARKLRVGQQVQRIVCDWNPRFPQHKLIIRNISGEKVGACFTKRRQFF